MNYETMKKIRAGLSPYSSFIPHPSSLVLSSLHSSSVTFAFSTKRSSALRLRNLCRDATFAPFLCQDAAHLLYWLLRAPRDRFESPLQFLHLRHRSSLLQRCVRAATSRAHPPPPGPSTLRAPLPIEVLAARIDASTNHVAHYALEPVTGLVIDQTLGHFKLDAPREVCALSPRADDDRLPVRPASPCSRESLCAR